MEDQNGREHSDTESVAPSEYSFDRKSNYSYVSKSLQPAFASSIRGQETFRPRERFTLFKVEVNNGERAWIVYRRYSDFVLLNKKLKKLFPGFVLSLPPKRIFRNNFEKHFIQRRQKGLEEFMKHLFLIPDVVGADPVRKFFRLDNPPGPHEDLTASRDYCESLEASVSRLKKEMGEQDYELSYLRSELAKNQYNIGNPNGFKHHDEPSLTEKILQQKLIAAEKSAKEAWEEVKRMKIDMTAMAALEESTRQTERKKHELQIRDLMSEFSRCQNLEDEGVKSMVSAFSGLGKVKINVSGKCIDVESVEGVTKREEDLRNAIDNSRKTLETIQKNQLESLQKKIEEQVADLVKTKYKLESAENEIKSLKENFARVQLGRDEEVARLNQISDEYKNHLMASKSYIEGTEQKYFYSLLLGVKLNLALWGKASGTVNQMKPHILFAKVRAQGVCIEDWPSWVSRELASLSKPS